MEERLNNNDALSSLEVERMNDYIQKIKEINEKRYNKTGKKPLMATITFGCQMNAHDSEKIAGILLEMGYDQTEDEASADLIVYNTCCVRENAENKVYGNLGNLKHDKELGRDLKIIVCGCMMQQDVVIEKMKKNHRHVDVILGTFNLHRLPELLFTNITTGETVIDIWKESSEIIDDTPIKRAVKYKSSVNIMYGCNNFCSYCIVPYVRGRERSRAQKDIITEIKNLVSDGVIEITLLGQNVNSYGKNTDDSFSKLLREVDSINGLERIRFMTSHPKDISDELIQTVADGKKICKHIHLPIQSGSTRLLEQMNRRYTKERFIEIADKIRSKIPGVSITTDILVAYPGETDDDFNDTIDVVKRVRFNGAFTFLYSKRTGTPAAAQQNQIPDDIARERFQKLLTVLNSISYEVNEQELGKTHSILVDGFSKNPVYNMTGRTDNNTLVHFQGDASLEGKIIDVKLEQNKTFYMLGTLK